MAASVIHYQPLRVIRLYGVLGAKFGREFRLAVDSPAEAIRALCALLPGFERFLANSKSLGLHYAVFRGGRNLTERELAHRAGEGDIRIAPILAGSKRAGAFQTILGVVLIVVGIIITVVSDGALAWIGEPMVNAGIAMAIGGVIQMMSPMPKGMKSREGEGNSPSYAFGGPVNTIAQGHPVGLLYGRRRIGGAIVSAGIHAEERL